MPEPLKISPDEKEIEPKESEVVVELDENNSPVKTEEPKKQEPSYVTKEEFERLAKASNYTNGALRKIQEFIEKEKVSKPVISASKPKEDMDEYDELVQKDWKQAVRKLSQAEYSELRRQEREQEQAEAEKNRNLNLLENNKRKVLEKHSELMDEMSEKAKIYQQVITEHPEYLGNPFGPVLAMRDMEDRLHEQGYVDEPTKKILEKEVLRQTRASASTIGRGASSSPTKTITLTKEQRELCDSFGIKYENYASVSQNLTKNQGVEV